MALTIEVHPAWLTRARAILRRLESDAEENSARFRSFQSQQEDIGLQVIAARERLRTIDDQARNAPANSQTQIEIQRSNTAAEIAGLQDELDRIKARLAAVSVEARVANALCEHARDVMRKIDGSTQLFGGA